MPIIVCSFFWLSRIKNQYIVPTYLYIGILKETFIFKKKFP